MIERRKLNISLVLSGQGSITGRLILPTSWLKEMGINENDREVKCYFDGEKIIVSKGELKMEGLNLKWVAISANDNSEDMKVFESKEAAIKEAVMLWEHLTDREKKKNRVIAALANVDETGNYAELENGNIDADLREAIEMSDEFVKEYRSYKGA